MDKSITAAWKEEAGADPTTDPLHDENGNIRIVVAVASTDFPDGYPLYCADNDLVKGQNALAIWSALGRPAS